MTEPATHDVPGIAIGADGGVEALAARRPVGDGDVAEADRGLAVATALSIVPGLGQLYNRQPGRAVVFATAVAVTIGPAVALLVNGEVIGLHLLGGNRSSIFLLFAFVSIVAFLSLFLLGIAFWASAVADARRNAAARSRGERATGGRWWFLQL